MPNPAASHAKVGYGTVVCITLIMVLPFAVLKCKICSKKCRVGHLLFHSFKKSKQEQFALSSPPKEQQGAICSFSFYQKSAQERSSPSIFAIRVTKSDLLFHSLLKEQKTGKRENCFLLLLLFCSFT